MYKEGEEAGAIFIVYKGEFEQAKKLPRGDKIFDNSNLHQMSSG